MKRESRFHRCKGCQIVVQVKERDCAYCWRCERVKYSQVWSRSVVEPASSITAKLVRAIVMSMYMVGVAAGLVMAHPINMDAIAQIETGGEEKPNEAKGSSGEIGLYQISPILLKHFNQEQFRNGGRPLCFKTQPNGDVDCRYQPFTSDDLKNPAYNTFIAHWYFSWLFDRCLTVRDTLVAWNWGPGNWRKWMRKGGRYRALPKTTRAYLLKYAAFTGEPL